MRGKKILERIFGIFTALVFLSYKSLGLWCLATLKKEQKLDPWCWAKKPTFCSCDCPVQTLPSDFQADTMSSLKDVICQSIPGHQGLKSSTNWPRTLEETLFPARTWSWSLYRPMTASAGLRMVKFRQRGSLGSWVALQPLAPSSERVNMALVCWDSSGDGPARENGWTGGGGLWEEEMNYVWGPEWR